MALATDTCVTPWRWCSLRTASSAVICRGVEVRLDGLPQAAAPCGRTRASAAAAARRTRRGCSSGQASGRWPVSACSRMLVGDQARAARAQDLVGEPPQVLDERQRQHARPRPQLADRQRRDALVAVQEQLELLPLEPAVAVAHQLDRHRVDPGAPEVLARGERRQLAGSRSAAGCDGRRRSAM